MNTSPASVAITPARRRSRRLQRTVFLTAALLTLIASFYIIEDWRGRRAWERCQQELRAQGEKLDWAAYVPARVPDEQNFIKTPLLEAVGYRGRVDTNVWRPFANASSHLTWEAWGDWQTGGKMDWEKCQAAVRRRTDLDLPPLPQPPAADVLLALRPVEPRLDELRAASLKPFAQFDIDRSAPFEESKDFNFVAVRSMSQILAFHACAELALGNHEKAFDDVRVLHRLSDAMKDETTLVAMMIRVAIQGLALEPFWQGWAEGRWSERDLASLGEIFGRVNLLPEFARVMHAERAGFNALAGKYCLQGNAPWRVTMRSEPEPKGWWDRTRQQAQKLAWRLVPRGWFYQNLATYNRRIQTCIPPSLQSNPPTVSPAQVTQASDQVVEEIFNGPYSWLSRMAIPNFSKALQHMPRIQNSVNQARVVCALERCRIARGQYPASLTELVPQFIDQLPVDVINGKPLTYRPTTDGRFVLYSVGWNETDDGGAPAVTPNKPASADFTRGDWVWRFPVDQP